MRIGIPLFSGVEELDAIGPFEVFGLASGAGLPVEVELVSHEGSGPVRGFHGAVFTALGKFGEEGRYDAVVVPGGAWLSGADDGVRRAVAQGTLPKILRWHYEQGAVLASVCTGTFLLEAAGVLSGVPAATHHLAASDLRSLGVQVALERVVDAGRIVTAGGITSGLDLALHLIEREFRAADRIASLMEYPWPRIG